MAKKAAKSAVGCQLTQEDADIAVARDRWNCAIVRCIQRTLPDSKYVQADRNHIEFTLERDDTRYEFQTPEIVVEKVIRRLDLGLAPELISFTLTDPISATPVQHSSQEQRQANRLARRARTARPAERSPRSSSPAVRTYGRFMDAESV